MLKSNAIKIQYTEDKKAELVLSLLSDINISDYKKIIEKGELLSVEIKQHREKRSLDANSYAWVLIGKIANVLRTDKDSVYIEMLKRYGQREEKLLSIIAEAVDMVFRATKNHCVEVGESELNGKTFKHLAILIGSSQYDSKSMAILIDGIVSECKEIDIETMTPEELQGLKDGWVRSKD